MKFWLPQKLLLYAKTYAASRESIIELLILVSGFMVNSRLKNTLWHFYKIHGMPYQGCVEEKKQVDIIISKNQALQI